MLPVDSEEGVGPTSGTPTSRSCCPAEGHHAAQHRRPAVRRQDADRQHRRRPTATCPNRCALLADTLWAVHTNDYDYAAAASSRTTRPRAPRASSSRRSTRPRTRSCACTRRPANGACSSAASPSASSGCRAPSRRDILRLLQAYVTRPENIVRVAVGARPARDLRQPDHPALRRRQLRRPAPPAAPGHRRRRRPGRRRRQSS